MLRQNSIHQCFQRILYGSHNYAQSYCAQKIQPKENQPNSIVVRVVLTVPTTNNFFSVAEQGGKKAFVCRRTDEEHSISTCGRRKLYLAARVKKVVSRCWDKEHRISTRGRRTTYLDDLAPVHGPYTARYILLYPCGEIRRYSSVQRGMTLFLSSDVLSHYVTWHR